jgi:GntR family transcriptional regulator
MHILGSCPRRSLLRQAVIEAAPEPRYQRVYSAIASAIGSGALKPGDRLPPEREICQELGVSRATARRALLQLHADGLVESSLRRGWFVRPPTVGEPPNALMSFTALAEARGLTPSARVLSQSIRGSTLDEATAFGVAPGAQLLDVERLLSLDDVPFAIDHSRVPVSLAPDFATADLGEKSIFDLLATSGAAPTYATVVVRAVVADDRQAELLDVDRGSALVLCSSTSCDETDRVVEVSDVAYPGSRYEFRATLGGVPRPAGTN